MKEWFESWFDTEFYHILYKNHDYSEAENFIQNLIDKVPINQTDSVLDLACGRGRHSIFLDSLGFRTTGVDLSPNNIAEANKFKSENLDFFVHDMRLPIETHRFDVVLNLFTSFGYFDQEENLKVLNAISSCLNPNGKLVIDFMNSSRIHDISEEESTEHIEGIEFHIQKRVENRHVIKHIRFKVDGKEHEYQENVSLLELRHFQDLFERSNFELEAIYGDYNLNEYQKDSDRLILVARKK